MSYLLDLSTSQCQIFINKSCLDGVSYGSEPSVPSRRQHHNSCPWCQLWVQTSMRFWPPSPVNRQLWHWSYQWLWCCSCRYTCTGLLIEHAHTWILTESAHASIGSIYILYICIDILICVSIYGCEMIDWSCIYICVYIYVHTNIHIQIHI